MHLTLRQLEVFVAVARCENVSRAARELALSQSAASSALAELERQFDRPLFDRLGKSLRLNSQGALLLPRADDLLLRARDLESLLAGQGLGPLAVGATLTIGNYLATLVVAEHLKRHPECRIELSVANTQALTERLLRCQIDLGLAESEIQHPELQSERWLEDRLVVFCAPGHPLAGRGAVSRGELLSQRWILREPGSGTRALFDRALGPDAAHLDVMMTLEHTEAIKRAVESGLGIACLSRLSLREALRRGSLVEIPTPGLDFARHFWFVWHRQRFVGASAQNFIRLCREIAGPARSSEDLALPYIA